MPWRLVPTPTAEVNARPPAAADAKSLSGATTLDHTMPERQAASPTIPEMTLLTILLNGLLTKLHIDTQKYNTHSFRIGTATTARQPNILDALIQLMGRWESNACLIYIKTPPMELAKLSKHLIINYQPPYTTCQSTT